jgi:hypothetical protein
MPGPRQTGKVSMAFQESYPQVRMVSSYFNNLGQEQTEVAHASRRESLWGMAWFLSRTAF